MFTLHDIVICLGSFTILISFVMAVYVRKKTDYKYLQLFYFEPLIGLLISVNAFVHLHFSIYNFKLTFLFQDILLIGDILFWTYFFFNQAKKNRLKRFIKIIFLIIGVMIITSFYLKGNYTPNFFFYSISNLWKSTLCLLYYNSIFSANPNLHLKKDPTFWIVTGIFFYSSLTLPHYSLHFYLKEHLSVELMNNVFAFTNISIVVMHIIFMKAYICILKEEKNLTQCLHFLI